MARFFSADHPFVRLVPWLLGAFLFALVIPVLTPTTYAAMLVPHAGACQYVYGTSYDADTLTLSVVYGPVYSFSQESAPSLAIVACGSNGIFQMESNAAGASSYHLAYSTATSQTTDVTLDKRKINADGDQLINFQASGFAPHQVYTFQLQACYGDSGCSAWSPHIAINTYTDIRCQPGYQFREAYPYDQVCVTAIQYTQAKQDNSLADTRVDPNGAFGPRSCTDGYVWRDAIGADYVCVNTIERARVWSDNSQSSAHIIQI